MGTSIFTGWIFCLWMHADSKRKVHMTHDYGPWKSHSHCGEGLNGANILEVASALISTTVH